MKICVTSQGNTLDTQVDPRFGRCNWFLIIDMDSMDVEAVENNQAQSMGGAGVQSGQLMAEKEVEAVLTGNAGPNAFQTLKAAGIEIVSGASGIVREAVEKYKRGEFQSADKPTVGSHFGMKGDG